MNHSTTLDYTYLARNTEHEVYPLALTNKVFRQALFVIAKRITRIRHQDIPELRRKDPQGFMLLELMFAVNALTGYHLSHTDRSSITEDVQSEGLFTAAEGALKVVADILDTSSPIMPLHLALGIKELPDFLTWFSSSKFSPDQQVLAAAILGYDGFGKIESECKLPEANTAQSVWYFSLCQNETPEVTLVWTDGENKSLQNAHPSLYKKMEAISTVATTTPDSEQHLGSPKETVLQTLENGIQESKPKARQDHQPLAASFSQVAQTPAHQILRSVNPGSENIPVIARSMEPKTVEAIAEKDEPPSEPSPPVAESKTSTTDSKKAPSDFDHLCVKFTKLGQAIDNISTTISENTSSFRDKLNGIVDSIRVLSDTTKIRLSETDTPENLKALTARITQAQDSINQLDGILCEVLQAQTNTMDRVEATIVNIAEDVPDGFEKIDERLQKLEASVSGQSQSIHDLQENMNLVQNVLGSTQFCLGRLVIASNVDQLVLGTDRREAEEMISTPDGCRLLLDRIYGADQGPPTVWDSSSDSTSQRTRNASSSDKGKARIQARTLAPGFKILGAPKHKKRAKPKPKPKESAQSRPNLGSPLTRTHDDMFESWKKNRKSPADRLGKVFTAPVSSSSDDSSPLETVTQDSRRLTGTPLRRTMPRKANTPRGKASQDSK